MDLHRLKFIDRCELERAFARVTASAEVDCSVRPDVLELVMRAPDEFVREVLARCDAAGSLCWYSRHPEMPRKAQRSSARSLRWRERSDATLHP